MGTYLTRYKFFTLIFMAALAAPSAQAQVPPLQPFNLKGEYKIAFNGIKIGRLKLYVEEDSFNYHMTVDVKSGGIARLISDESSVSEASGRFSATAPYIPSYFSTQPQGNHEGDRIKLTYDPAGVLASRTDSHEDHPSWRAPVTAAELGNAPDPITAAFTLRRLLHSNMKINVRDSMVRAYDGERLYEMHFKVISPARVELMGKYVDAINTVVTRVPVAGYTPKELKKYKEGDPVIHLYFSADGKFIPIRATVSLPYGELSVTLVGYN